MTLAAPLPPPTLRRPAADPRRGAALLLGAAVVWSAGGLFARALAELDPWTVVFWRSVFAALFLAGFVAAREGARGLPAAFRAIGGPGLAVAACFAVASTAFVVALAHTTVANVLLVQAGVPLLAALLARLALGERIAGPTWAAIAATLLGVAVMVSGSLGGTASPTGDLLALTIAVAYATATVVTRRFARVRMTPAAVPRRGARRRLRRDPGGGLSPRRLRGDAGRAGAARRLRGAELRARAGALRHRRAAAAGGDRGADRRRRDRARAALGLARLGRDPGRPAPSSAAASCSPRWSPTWPGRAPRRGRGSGAGRCARAHMWPRH